MKACSSGARWRISKSTSLTERLVWVTGVLEDVFRGTALTWVQRCQSCIQDQQFAMCSVRSVYENGTDGFQTNHLRMSNTGRRSGKGHRISERELAVSINTHVEKSMKYMIHDTRSLETGYAIHHGGSVGPGSEPQRLLPASETRSPGEPRTQWRMQMLPSSRKLCVLLSRFMSGTPEERR